MTAALEAVIAWAIILAVVALVWSIIIRHMVATARIVRKKGP